MVSTPLKFNVRFTARGASMYTTKIIKVTRRFSRESRVEAISTGVERMKERMKMKGRRSQAPSSPI